MTMQTLEYRTIDKSTWGAGPWQDEPDKMQYADPVTGLPCLIVRGPQGSLCGYVGVAEGHPYYKQDGYSFDVDVHGGITFTNSCSPHDTEETGVCHIPGAGETDNIWWLGFDCAHSGDFCPGMDAQLKGLGVRSFQHITRDTYRDLAYVKAHIAGLALQLSTVKA